MHNLYFSNHYTDQFSTYSQGERNFVELSLSFMHLLPRSFEVPTLIPNNQDYYFLMFGISLQFLIIEEDVITLDSSLIEFNKFRFSIMGICSDYPQSDNYQQYPLDYSFKDFIKKTYEEFLKKTPFIVHDKRTYHINELNQELITQGLHYLDQIFPYDKNMVLLNEINADFYTQQDSGTEEGVYIYEKSRIINHVHLLEEQLPLKQNKLKTQPFKI